MPDVIATLRANLHELIRNFTRDEGQDMIEYALLAGLIAVFCIAALVVLGPQIFSFYNVIHNTLQATFPSG